MDRMQGMTAFVAVAEERNFAAAARRMGMSPASVTRAIAGLEEHLGLKLVFRTTRSVRLTEAGDRYLDDVRVILAKINEANESAASAQQVMRGHLNVTAPVLFGALHVVPCVARYLDQFPEMTVSGYFLDRVVDLVEEGIDVAVRIGGRPGLAMQGIAVGGTRRVLCASPAYLAARGTPQHPAELEHHDIIAAQGISPVDDWSFRSESMDLTVRVAPKLTVSSNDAALTAATLGLGITRLFHYQIAALVAERRLQIVLPEHEGAAWPIHVVYDVDGASAKVRAFVELLVAHLSHPGADA
ncbi:LysR family transcriptional regulator [Paucibacter sp. R3-3]|uniref:LysR family transcriptional regulator n=1 Tax=Roseateles agri TaxID=3098619 RepID=A0ABU5DKE0_9BURK|nr:LysR family transcriptional regulator [Paucibacter sp. R3-3]MDY0746768.1 LysR family transcriptional regulator [Paucibacter sp. R3-3]